MSFIQPSTLRLMYCSLNDSVPITDPRRHSPWSVILIPSLKIFVRIALDHCFLLRRLFLQVWGSTQSLVHWPVGIPTIFSHLLVIRLLSYHPYTISVSFHHLQFNCSVLVSLVMWIGHPLP